MAYTLEIDAADRDWDFPAPQQGEADTAQDVALFRKQVGGRDLRQDREGQARLERGQREHNRRQGRERRPHRGGDRSRRRHLHGRCLPSEARGRRQARRHDAMGHDPALPSNAGVRPQRRQRQRVGKLDPGFTIKIDGAADTFIDGAEDVTLPAARQGSHPHHEPDHRPLPHLLRHGRPGQGIAAERPARRRSVHSLHRLKDAYDGRVARHKGLRGLLSGE